MQKLIAKLSLVSLITILMLGFFVTTVQADGLTATRTETYCDTSSYGVKNCHEVVIDIPVHDTTKVGTALPNLNVVIAALGLVLVLSTASYIYTK